MRDCAGTLLEADGAACAYLLLLIAVDMAVRNGRVAGQHDHRNV
jgi:hypothetical protein